ncbi:MAG: PAS domain S-box protein [Gemmatimonadaceae bacterium]
MTASPPVPEAAAAGTHRRLEDAFFDVAIDMLCLLGFDGYFRRLNPAWEKTLGFTREELMSRPFLEFVHLHDRERTLREILPICSYCRKIRDDENYWHTVEGYISRHTDTRFSHGVCPSCMAAHAGLPADGD